VVFEKSPADLQLGFVLKRGDVRGWGGATMSRLRPRYACFSRLPVGLESRLLAGSFTVGAPWPLASASGQLELFQPQGKGFFKVFMALGSNACLRLDVWADPANRPLPRSRIKSFDVSWCRWGAIALDRACYAACESSGLPFCPGVVRAGFPVLIACSRLCQPRPFGFLG